MARKVIDLFQLKWDEVVEDSFSAIREMFGIVADRPHCQSVLQCPNSRALYAIDLMVKKESNGKLQPVILEVNFIADTDKFVQFYPNFYNEVFELLFLNKFESSKFTLLQ